VVGGCGKGGGVGEGSDERGQDLGEMELRKVGNVCFSYFCIIYWRVDWEKVGTAMLIVFTNGFNVKLTVSRSGPSHKLLLPMTSEP